MQKNLFIAAFMFLSLFSFGQTSEYPYTTRELLLSNKLVLGTTETRNTETDTFQLTIRNEGLFNSNCMPLKRLNQTKALNQTKFSVSSGDTSVYEKGKLKTRTTFLNLKPNNKYTFNTSVDGSIDTLFYQNYDSLGNLSAINRRDIRFKNRSGLDSVFTTQTLVNGTWQIEDTYIEYFYNNLGQLVKANYAINNVANYVDNKNIRRRVINYFNNGKNLTLRVDSVLSNTTATLNKIIEIYKSSNSFDSKGRLVETIESSWTSASVDTSFTLSKKRSVTAFDAQNRETEIISYTWFQGGWVESQKVNSLYSSDGIFQENLTYLLKVGWWLKQRYIAQYCNSTLNPTQEITPIALKIYPNPAQSIITLEAAENETTSNNLEVFDTFGHKVLDKKDIRLPYSFDVSNQPNGIYFLKLSNNKGQLVTKKVLIMK